MLTKMRMENTWWLRRSKKEQHLIERRRHQEHTTLGTEGKKLFEEINPIPRLITGGSSQFFLCHRESKLCVLTCLGLCRAFGVLGSYSTAHGTTTALLPSSPSSFLQLFP